MESARSWAWEEFGHLAVGDERRRDRLSDGEFVFVPIDGTSIHIVDRGRQTDLGLVGTHSNNARGLNVVTALAVSGEGTTLYTGKSSGGSPGAITIARGMENVAIAAQTLEALRASRKKR